MSDADGPNENTIAAMRAADDVYPFADDDMTATAAAAVADRLIAEAREQERAWALPIVGRYERHLTALHAVITDIADHGPLTALENLGDYLNGCDAVDAEAIEAFDRAKARLS